MADAVDGEERTEVAEEDSGVDGEEGIRHSMGGTEGLEGGLGLCSRLARVAVARSVVVLPALAHAGDATEGDRSALATVLDRRRARREALIAGSHRVWGGGERRRGKGGGSGRRSADVRAAVSDDGWVSEQRPSQC